MSDDRVELGHGRCVRINGSIFQDGFINEIARHIAVGVGHVIGILRRNIGSDQKINQRMRLLGIGRVLGYCQVVEPQLRAFLRE